MNTKPTILGPGEGRAYECGPMHAVFKADDSETAGRYSVSEWTVAPRSPGSGPHSHETNDELFLVTDGIMAVRVGEEWIDAPRGTFLLVPAGITHDFENRTDQPATLFNVFIPGGFEHMMPQIVAWFAGQSSGALPGQRAETPRAV
jgi:mannose-6-phosphate isomerase-like protein (cupin superfamily)